MKKRSLFGGILVILMLAVFHVASLPAQTDGGAQEKGKPEKREGASERKGEKSIPEAALLTERGRQLAEELRILRRTRDSMGSKHPTLPLVEQKIAAVEEQLEAWEPAFGQPPQNPFDAQEASPQMNEYDLRQVVIRLTKRVEALEQRVSQLEAKLK